MSRRELGPAVDRLRTWIGGTGPALAPDGRTLRADIVTVLDALTTTSQPLTERQVAILDFIRETIRVRRCAPSFAEIAREFGFRSLGTVHEHLNNLEAKGAIRRDFNRQRGIVLAEEYAS